jgi:allantoin racemase
MKIWYQSAVEISGANAYREALKQHFGRIVDPGVEVDVFGVEPGTWAGHQPSQLFGYPAIFHAALGGAFLRNAVRAEKEGYDAFIIGTYIEPYLRELRSAVDIPVISSLEATLLVGCSTAHTIGIITLNRELLWSLKISLERHRLGDRVRPLLIMEPELNERQTIELLSSPDAYLSQFTEIARRAVADNADAIIPGEGILAECVAANGITSVDGAVVLDGIGIPVAYAQMMVGLWRKTGLRVGRRWHYAKPSPDLVTTFLARLPTVQAPDRRQNDPSPSS